MKNYIANEAVTTTSGQRIATSSAYIRQELELAIKEGRPGKNDENKKYEAFRHLGAALHTLEGIVAYHVFDPLRKMWEYCPPTMVLGLSSTPIYNSLLHFSRSARVYVPMHH